MVKILIEDLQESLGTQTMTGRRIDASNLIAELRRVFPELEESYQRLLQKWGVKNVRSNYAFVGDILQPRFEHDVLSGEATDFLRRCASFMERVCRDGDVEAINVIWVRIFEWLIFRPRELNLLWPLLGPATRENIKDAARRWSYAKRLYGQKENLPEENIPKEAD